MKKQEELVIINSTEASSHTSKLTAVGQTAVAFHFAQLQAVKASAAARSH